jgi:hypothetical protein
VRAPRLACARKFASSSASPPASAGAAACPTRSPAQQREKGRWSKGREGGKLRAITTSNSTTTTTNTTNLIITIIITVVVMISTTKRMKVLIDGYSISSARRKAGEGGWGRGWREGPKLYHDGFLPLLLLLLLLLLFLLLLLLLLSSCTTVTPLPPTIHHVT